jgi:mannose/fructose/N-acetylgalactosamine-specific phosphotransferase system component IIC
LWLALPSRGDNVAWGRALPAVFAVIVVLAVIRVKWQILVYAIPIAIVVAILAVFIRPRSKPRPPRR